MGSSPVTPLIGSIKRRGNKHKCVSVCCVMENLVLATFGGLCVVALMIKWLTNNGQTDRQKEATGPNQSQESLLWNLQWRFFSAYFLAIFADWLQGPYIYQLYSSYGFAEKDIAVLF